LMEAIERIKNMNNDEYLQMRENARKHVEENFTVEKMVDGYEEVYRKVLGI
jgi:glycosyltransferase involved in cell wall biosynthesis